MTYTSGELLFAFALTIFAGLSTGIGSALAFFAKKTSTRFLTGSLGFSAGVMIYVAMIEIFVKGKDAVESSVGPATGYLYATMGFFGGILLIAVIDKLVPSFENPHEIHDINEMLDADEAELKKRKNLHRMGIFSALAIAIHNFPEGLATFIGALQDPALGLSIAVAIAIHNIPEGIAVSVPLYYATGSRKKAFFYSVLSGLSEPLGAMLGYFLLFRYINDFVFGLLFAAVAGIMVFISLDELLPAAEKYGEHHIAMYGVVGGMAVMAISLVLFV
ncbi:MAG: zinc transporter ZupT [Desulfobulbales bacterium]|nr:zinc transporter ZupT [Desulfobulbales bacterium]